MKDNELDRILSKEPEIVPSSGFVAAVMDTVRREAATPPPIAFPWRYALPGLVAAGVMVVSIVILGFTQLVRMGPAASTSTTFASTLASILQAANMAGAGWIAVALLLSLASLLLRMRLGGIRD